MEQTESSIIRQLKEGTDEAYKYLYEHHYQVLCHVAEQLVHDSFLAETIVGDVIFQIWKNRKSIDFTSSLRAYLLKGVRNRCLNHLKSQYVQREFTMSSLGPQCANIFGHLQENEHPLGRLLEQELEENIMSSIDRLPELSRRVFKMNRFEKKIYEDIAIELGISVNTVKYHIKQALALLRGELSKYLVVVILLFISAIEI